MHARYVPAIAGAFALALLAGPAATPAAGQEVQQLRWATSAVGSGGHRAKVALMALLNREIPEYSITVLPTPGAVATVRGFALGQFEGFYGADLSFEELATDSGRFEGFLDQVENEPIQSFWAFTMELGVGVRAADAENFSGWRDLAGRSVFTGPAPWDTRAQLERAFAALDVGHEYVELDLGLAGSSLAEGTIDAFSIYTTGESSPAPWVSEAILTTDVAILNPNDEEVAALEEAGFEIVTVDASTFEASIQGDQAMLVPFFYGFHVGMNVPEDDVYRMLVTIEENVDELVAGDPAFAQIQEDMVDMQRRGIAASIEHARVHPGLARYMRERDAWDESWDDRIAD